MKPFDLEAAKRGEPIQTRDGRPVRFIAHVPNAYLNQRVVVLMDRAIQFTSENGYFISDEEKSSWDLVMAPRKRTVWVNLYRPRDYDYLCQNMPASAYDNENEANNAISSYVRIGNRAWPLEIEE